MSWKAWAMGAIVVGIVQLMSWTWGGGVSGESVNLEEKRNLVWELPLDMLPGVDWKIPLPHKDLIDEIVGGIALDYWWLNGEGAILYLRFMLVVLQGVWIVGGIMMVGPMLTSAARVVADSVTGLVRWI